MSAWIGPRGNLIEFKCPSAVESSTEDAHVYFRPLGGAVSSTVLGDPVRPRVWNVDVSTARPDQVNGLQGIAEGEWGPGPFTFIPPAAETLNLLGKRDALAMGGEPGTAYTIQNGGAPAVTTEGPAGSAYITTREVPVTLRMGWAPAIPGRPVTGKAWVTGNPTRRGALWLSFRDVAGTELSLSSFVYTSGAEFLSVTATPPAGTASVVLSAMGMLLTRPQVTWTTTPRAWAPSAASTNVVMSALSNSMRRATGAAGEEQITDHTFTVQELTA